MSVARCPVQGRSCGYFRSSPSAVRLGCRGSASVPLRLRRAKIDRAERRLAQLWTICHPERNDVSRSDTECSRGTLRLHSKAGGSCSLTSACHPERNDVSRSETECSRGTLRLHSKPGGGAV